MRCTGWCNRRCRDTPTTQRQGLHTPGGRRKPRRSHSCLPGKVRLHFRSSSPPLFICREANDKILRVDDALTADPNTADWFKVGELGLIRRDYWGTDAVNANCGRYAFKIPPCIPSGDYLIRAESKPVSFYSRRTCTTDSSPTSYCSSCRLLARWGPILHILLPYHCLRWGLDSSIPHCQVPWRLLVHRSGHPLRPL